MRRMWEWCLKYLPEDRTNRYLAVTVIVSVLFHILIGVGLIVGGNIEQRKMIAKRGEAILVDIAPDKPKETAPLGNPSRPVGPNAPEPPRQAAPPTPPAPKAAPAPPAPAAPKVAEAPKAAPKAPPAAPKSAEPGPAPKAAPPAPDPDQGQTAKATPQTPPPQPPSPAADQRVASAPPQAPPTAGMFRRGGGGGLKGGRGGIEGDPIPLDTPDPRYQDYFNEIRRRIQSHFVYPYEAAIRNIGGEVSIDFGIAKSGQLQFIEQRRSSGVEILDGNAIRAIELASPFPPVPDAISKTGIPIFGTFIYLSNSPNSTLIRNYLR